MKTDSYFGIASTRKPFTAAALLILAHEGNVSVSDPVEKYVPEFKDMRVKATNGALVPTRHPILKRR